METQQWSAPVIDNYGKIKYFKDAAMQLDKIREYKAVFSISSNEDPKTVNPHLCHVALLLNILEASGIAKENIKVAVVISAGATDITLNNEAYMKLHNQENPNLELERKLTENGVEILICGQSIAQMQYDRKDLNEYTVFSLSALTDLLIFEQQGYILLP